MGEMDAGEQNAQNLNQIETLTTWQLVIGAMKSVYHASTCYQLKNHEHCIDEILKNSSPAISDNCKQLPQDNNSHSQCLPDVQPCHYKRLLWAEWWISNSYWHKAVAVFFQTVCITFFLNWEFLHARTYTYSHYQTKQYNIPWQSEFLSTINKTWISH